MCLLLERPSVADPPSRTPERPLPDRDVSYVAGQTSEVVEGRTVRVTVPILGEPTPRVTWTLPSGQRLQPGERSDRFTVTDDGSLQIEDSQTDDSGDYRVTASNAAGETSVVTPVSVFGKILVSSS